MDQDSYLSQQLVVEEADDAKFIALDREGRFVKGQMHIKATLESDHLKSVLIEINDEDTIGMLRKKIGERFETRMDLFNGLNGI